jgi:hypothetical protein
MSIIYKCDSCGKLSTQTGVTFSKADILKRVKTIDGRNARIYLNIRFELEEDIQAILGYYGVKSKLYPKDNANVNDSFDTMMKDVSFSTKELPELTASVPLICDLCRKMYIKELATASLSELESPCREPKNYVTEKDPLNDEIFKFFQTLQEECQEQLDQENDEDLDLEKDK